MAQRNKPTNKVDDYLSKYDNLKKKRSYYEQVWDLITKYVYPRRDAFGTDTDIRVKDIYDSTALSSHSLMVDAFTGYLISRSSPWFRLSIRDYKTSNDRALKGWLEDAEKGMYGELERANFYDTIPTTIADGTSIGTALIYAEEDEARGLINYVPRHPKEAYIAVDRYGKVDTVYRHFYQTGKQILEVFGEKAIPTNMLNQIKQAPFNSYEILHVVEPRVLRDEKKIDAKNKRYASIYILLGIGNADTSSIILKEGGYDDFPYIVWRFKIASTEEYGRSYVWDALPDIIRANSVAKTLMEAAQLNVRPPLQYPAEMKYNIEIVPNGMTPYTSPARLIKPIQLGQNYPIGERVIMDLRNSIREQLKVDFFLLLSRIAQQKGEMTAREVIELAGEKAAVLGTIMGRINSELLDPILEKTLIMGLKAGRIPPPPKEYVSIIGRKMKIDYIGTMAQAQKRLQATQGISQSLSQLLPLAQFYPGILDVIDQDKLGVEILERSGMPVDIIKTETEISEERKRKLALMQAMQASQNQQNQGGQGVQTGQQSAQVGESVPEGL